jgi:hypothetical protein
MIDRLRRDQMGELLRGLASGAVTEERFIDDAGSRLAQESTDPGVQAAYKFAGSWIFDDSDLIVRRRRPLPRAVRRQFALVVLFLHSDSEYEWPEDCLSSGVDSWDLALLLLCGISTSIALLTFALVAAHLAFLAVHIAAVVLAVVSWLWSYDHAVTRREDFRNHLKQVGDIEVWPFLRTAAFDAAKTRPRLLAGA